MIKNNQQIEIKTEIRNKGNWNYKNSGLDSINTKPIGIITLEEDEFVFKHEDIFKLIEFYHEVNIDTIRKINNSRFNSGDIKECELPFLYKLKAKIKEMEKKLMEECRK